MKALLGQQFDSITAATNVMRASQVEYDAAQAIITSLANSLEQDAGISAKRIDDAVRLVQLSIGLSVSILLIMMIPVTVASTKSICKPIQNAERLAHAISQGRLVEGHVDVTGEDEPAHLMRGLASMRRALRDTVTQVRSSKDIITLASSSISAGTQDLNSRTEQTVASLEEAAASSEQLTGTVKQSAASANHANELASNAAEVATRGGAVVSQVLSTMQEITASSKKIAEIIAVIDGIAFQTNILALNAAVEAARADEEGRGFAVVAGEVRNLAHRSSQAAREIRALIGASVTSVENGATLVTNAGRTMTEIVNSVKSVADIVGEISAAAAEQSDGIDQLNSSVAHIDQMTQRNSTLAHESLTAADNLARQSNTLTGLVGALTLTESSTGTVRPVPRSLDGGTL